MTFHLRSERQSGDARSDDSHFMMIGCFVTPSGSPAHSFTVFEDKTLDVANANGNIDGTADARVLTGTLTGERAKFLHRVRSRNEIIGFAKFALGNLLHIGLDGNMVRTGGFTRGAELRLAD